ncbi:hypothetical protein G6011_06196 [Alternaria panax]|uniref:Uncharacterized protein n=1 Tax=Alternaria panax TaxID=48097 RepID=A0AAD4I7V4_9PLEO|nr:hypothetical protein G6011_06196 [Alternaria panax]
MLTLAALYLGYKRRNAVLDTQELPVYLASKTTSIIAQQFDDVDNEATLREVHDYLFRKYNLLDRVIRARRLHHSHFFAIDNDYDHERYLDRLQNERYSIVKALEKLGKRAATVMYEQKQWFCWVKQCQEKEEEEAQSEGKKVKLESLLFKRHQKEIDRHQRERRSRENEKRQEQYLDKVYVKSLMQMSKEEQEKWDPIQDVYGYEKDSYVELIKFFLMLNEQEHDKLSVQAEPSQLDGPADPKPAEKALSKSAKKRARKTNAETKKLEDSTTQGDGGKSFIEMETKEQMRGRLLTPVQLERVAGYYVHHKELPEDPRATSVLPDDEIEQLLAEIGEIKNLLFCRLLLASSALLPIAIQTNSIEEFLQKEDVTREHLRDLCLKLERPSLQDVRDACADFIRERDGADESEVSKDLAKDSFHTDITEEIMLQMHNNSGQRSILMNRYRTKHERAIKKKPQQQPPESEQNGLVDFGNASGENELAQKRIKIRVCGRDMYNYRSEQALNRSGWFHFSIIAKDSNLADAIALCRNWDEFFELNILTTYHYFLAPKWTKFTGNAHRQQLVLVGFIPYFQLDNAEAKSSWFQTGGRGIAGRSHEIKESRNIICGYIKRNDAFNRRFIQYLTMESGELRALIRDPVTGYVIVQPPEQELWLSREKTGIGRASKREYNITSEVGPAFIEEVEARRSWQINFDDYYDVYIWDAAPGGGAHELQQKIEEVFAHALRFQTTKDMLTRARHIFQTVTQEVDTGRIRSVRPGEKVQTMADVLDGNAEAASDQSVPKTQEAVHDMVRLRYEFTEADEVEDAILFPRDTTSDIPNRSPRYKTALEKLQMGKLRTWKIGYDLSTDEESSGSDSDSEPKSESGEDEGKAEMNENARLHTDLRSKHPPGRSSGKDLHKHLFEADQQAHKQRSGPLVPQYKWVSRTKDPDYFLPLLRNSADAGIVTGELEVRPSDLMYMLRTALRRQRVYDEDGRDIGAMIEAHSQRSKDRVTKECCHLGDLEPGGLSRYNEHQSMVTAMDKFVMSGINAGPFELCKLMRMAPLFRKERRTVDDAFQAYAAIAMFYETESFLASEHGTPFKSSLLFNQEERAKRIPDRRTHLSNKYMPAKLWADRDKLLKDNKRGVLDFVEDIYPMEWRKAIRSVMIPLFKADVIRLSYHPQVSGVVTAAAEPGRSLDLYIDCRHQNRSTKMIGEMVDPTPLDRDYIIKTIKQFRAQHAWARFSALRMWTAPHFYPMNAREGDRFLDDRGRLWEWKYIPKDMPMSEWSVHKSMTVILGAYEDVWKGRVVVARDVFLVMGKDADECRRLSEGVTCRQVSFPALHNHLKAAKACSGPRPKRNPPADPKTHLPAQSMLLHADPSLAEVPGFTKEQLDALARSVELRRQQLEDDIRDYIKAKQDELRRHGQELVDRYRSMACDHHSASAEQNTTSNAESTASPLHPEPEERIKQKKHTRVHKREKELYGLVTPVFLPLLDARDSSPEKKKKKPKTEVAHCANTAADSAQAGASRDAEQSKDDRKSRKDNKDMECAALGEPGKENQPAETVKKAKRMTMKKSALRHKDKPRPQRKRVSLVIDGQTVRPADTVEEPPLTSPSSEATSASNSTASLDDLIDPRLTTQEPPVYLEHRDAVHHSLPLPMTNAIDSASKNLSETPKTTSIAAEHSPPLPSPRAPSIALGSAQTATRTFLDPSPSLPPQAAHFIPETAGPDPIYSTAAATSAELEIDNLADDDTNFDTYVGGLHGSGVDDVDQAGSYGYPSSLGASYMESYMQNRPLSVRMQAANKAGLGDEEKRRLLEEKDEEAEEDDDLEDDFKPSASSRNKAVDTGDDNFMGDMDDF